MTSLRKAWEVLWPEIHIKEEIGKGGFGIVYSAHWRDMMVAVKTVNGHFSVSDVNAEFDKEIATLQLVRHPNIVLFFGAGTTEDGTPFLVTELVELGDLRNYLATHAIGWDRKLQFALDTAEGMAHLHSLGKIHRDLKSGNLLVSASLRVKVADFGTAAFASHAWVTDVINTPAPIPQAYENWSLSPATSMKHTKGVGTPLWMAPELLEGRSSYGQRVDVYSFGIVMWEIASQAAPWSHIKFGAFVMSQLVKLVNSGQRPPTDPSWPLPYRRLMSSCWATEPEDRLPFDRIRTAIKFMIK